MGNKVLFGVKSVFRHDLPASITVFFVALPLCLGIALASGAPPQAGIISGVIGGIVVSLISRSTFSVSGPAAGLATIVAAGVAANGDYASFLPAVIIAGIFQITLGVLRVGGFVNYFPSSVIKGMLAGIGLLLIGKQVPVALGIDGVEFWSELEEGDFQSIGKRTASAALFITVVSVAMLTMLPKYAARYMRLVPAPLVVVMVAIALAVVLPLIGPQWRLNISQLVQVPENLAGSMVYADFHKALGSVLIWKTGIIIGIIATLESLLCVEAIDKLDPHKRTSPVNRELIAQGVGNAACGFLGGIPITAVIVRGSANVQSGAQSRASAFLHGIFLLAAVLWLPFVINRIPSAALAAILIVTGYKLCKPSKIRAVFRLGAAQFFPFVVTVMLVVAVDLLAGVLTGVAVACYFILQKTVRAEYNVKKTRSGESEVYDIRLHSNVTFLNKIKLKRLLDNIPDYSIVRVNGVHSHYIDHDVLELFAEYRVRAHDRHIELALLGVEQTEVAEAH